MGNSRSKYNKDKQAALAKKEAPRVFLPEEVELAEARLEQVHKNTTPIVAFTSFLAMPKNVRGYSKCAFDINRLYG